MFDCSSERCLDCDGHYRHFQGCPLYEGEPTLNLMDRLALRISLDSQDD